MEVRQQCYFGCVLCGMPFFEYDHIEEYAQVKEHTSENLVLLCPNHHAAKTTKKLSKERIIEAKKKPFNSHNKYSSAYKMETSKQVSVILGSNQFVNAITQPNQIYSAIWINGKSYLTIYSENWNLTLDMVLTDSLGTPILVIEQGEMRTAIDVVDFEYVGNNIKILVDGSVYVDINLTNELVKVNKGVFCDNAKDAILITNNAMISFMDEQEVGFSSGSTYVSSHYGHGILNYKNVQNLTPPVGFTTFIGRK